MALSGSLTKKYFYSNTHCHWIEWSATQSIANNQSTVTIAFKSTWTSGYGTYSESANINQIRLNGTNYTRSTSIKGSVGTVTQFSTTQTITHGADGKATFTLGGRHRLNSSYGDYVYWNDVTFTLDTIPRTTEITGFSNFNSDSTSVSVTLDRKSSSFSHDISLSLGGTTIATWTGSTANFTGTKALSLTTAQRNALLAKLPTATSGTATIKVVTKNSGGTTIGTKTKTATYSILSTVKPTISGVTTTITTPTGAISGLTRSYAIQNISTVKIGYTRTAPHGTTISSATVKLGDAAATSNNPGSFVPTKSGSVSYTITVKDKRGRVNTATGSVSVTAYGGLAAQLVHIQRPQGSNEAQNKMTVRLKLTVPAITAGGSTTNAFNVKITSKPVDGSSSTSTAIDQTYNPGTASGTLYNYNPSMTYLETKPYDVTIVVKDDFKTVTLAGRLSTASFPFVLGPDGVGIGKIPEAGRVLDVAGTAYFNTFRGNWSIPDIRSDSNNPSDIPSYNASWAFKYRTSVGNPPVAASASSTYAYILRIAGWQADASGGGGGAIEVSFGTSNVAIRQATSSTAWTPWVLIGGSSSIAWGNVTGKPSTFPPSSHTHSYVPTSRTVNGKALSANISLTAANVGAQQVARTANGSTGTITNATWTSVSYGKTFAATPSVVATGINNVAGESFAKIRNRSTTGFEIIVGGTGTSNAFNWIAIATG